MYTVRSDTASNSVTWPGCCCNLSNVTWLLRQKAERIAPARMAGSIPARPRRGPRSEGDYSRLSHSYRQGAAFRFTMGA